MFFLPAAAAGAADRRSVEAAQLDQLVIHLDDVVADDHLTLRPACDDAHDAGRLFESCNVCLGRVGQGEPQPGGAMLQMGHIFVARRPDAERPQRSAYSFFTENEPPCSKQRSPAVWPKTTKGKRPNRTTASSLPTCKNANEWESPHVPSDPACMTSDMSNR